MNNRVEDYLEWEKGFCSSLSEMSDNAYDGKSIPMVTKTYLFEKGFSPEVAASHVAIIMGVKHAETEDTGKGGS